jgi:hypothetical protein
MLIVLVTASYLLIQHLLKNEVMNDSKIGGYEMMNVSKIAGYEKMEWDSVTEIGDGMAVEKLQVSNHYSFPIREPISFAISSALLSDPEQGLQAVIRGGERHGEIIPVQVAADADSEETNGQRIATMEIELAPGESNLYTFIARGSKKSDSSKNNHLESPEILDNFPSGLPRQVRLHSGKELSLFDIRTFEIVDSADLKETSNPSDLQRLLHRLSMQESQALLLADSDSETYTLQASAKGPVKSKLTYSGRVTHQNEYELTVEYTFYSKGIVDVAVLMERAAGNHDKGYLGVIKDLRADSNETATMRWKGDLHELNWGANSFTGFVRSHFWGRDVSWLAVSDYKGLSRALLADFVPGLSRKNSDGIYRPVNDFLVNELVLGHNQGWQMVSAISGANPQQPNYIRESHVLPASGEKIRLNYRYLTSVENVDAANQAFNTYAGYRSAQSGDGNLVIDFGVKEVSFGTSYFPHSTFGENFEYWKSAGLSGERWWPVFKNWHYFKEDIKRDMRIARAMGLDLIRIHHFDAPRFEGSYLKSEAGAWMLEYLDFMVSTAEASGLKIFLDFRLSPEDAKMVAEKYGQTIRFFEMENETLLLGVRDEQPDRWTAVRNGIKEVDPKLPVFVTGGPNFQSLYERLDDLDVTVDAIGQHAYVDGRQVPENVKDSAIALGGYASRKGKIPLNSEYNWRFITRETEQQQADHFEEIYESFLSQRAVPILLQFQFNETFAVPPKNRGALRHYEVLRSDRTLKPQGKAYMEIIRRYAAADHPARVLEIEIPRMEISDGDTFTLPVTIRNLSDRELMLETKALLPAGFSMDDSSKETKLQLMPGQTQIIEREVKVEEGLRPGFYHLFEEIRYDNEIFFGWGHAANRKSPKLNLSRAPLEGVRYVGGTQSLNEIDLSDLNTVLFGADAHSLEVDWALYLYNSLRSSTGAPIQRFSDLDDEVDELLGGNLLFIGNQRSNTLIQQIEKKLKVDPQSISAGEGLIQVIDSPFAHGKKILIVSGKDPQGIQKAASDLLLRYWQYAKDAASFREGMGSVVSDWISVKPDKGDAGMLLIKGPIEGRAGEELRFTIMDTAEPPSPSPNQKLIAVSEDGVQLSIGQSDDSGEITYTFQNAGIFDLKVVGRDGEPAPNFIPFQLTVKK